MIQIDLDNYSNIEKAKILHNDLNSDENKKSHQIGKRWKDVDQSSKLSSFYEKKNSEKKLNLLTDAI